MGRAILTIDATEPLGLVEALRQKRATMIAANRAAKSARTVMVRAVAKRLGLKQNVVRPRVGLQPARIDNDNMPFVAFHVDAKPVELIHFRARQLKRAGVKATEGGQTKTFRGAFIATVRNHPTFRLRGSGNLLFERSLGAGRISSHRGVFRRKKETRSRKGMPWGTPELPIRQMYGLSIANGVDDTLPKALARFRERFPEELFRALRYGRRRR